MNLVDRLREQNTRRLKEALCGIENRRARKEDKRKADLRKVIRTIAWEMEEG